MVLLKQSSGTCLMLTCVAFGACRLLKEGAGAKALVHFEKALMLAKFLGNRVQERRAVRGLAAASRIQVRSYVCNRPDMIPCKRAECLVRVMASGLAAASRIQVALCDALRTACAAAVTCAHHKGTATQSIAVSPAFLLRRPLVLLITLIGSAEAGGRAAAAAAAAVMGHEIGNVQPCHMIPLADSIPRCRAAQSQYTAAISHLQRVLEISTEMGDHVGDADAYGTIADIYTDMGDFDAAAKCAFLHCCSVRLWTSPGLPSATHRSAGC